MRPSATAAGRLVGLIAACLSGALQAGCISIVEDSSVPPWQAAGTRRGWGVTPSRLAAAIDGPGFFILRDDGGGVFYTRRGLFRARTGTDEHLTEWCGLTALPLIPLAKDLGPETHLAWDEGGTLYTAQAPDGRPERAVGSVRLALFWRPERLAPVYLEKERITLYRATPEAGPPQVGPPGTGGRGVLRPGFVEFRRNE